MEPQSLAADRARETANVNNGNVVGGNWLEPVYVKRGAISAKLFDIRTMERLTIVYRYRCQHRSNSVPHRRWIACAHPCTHQEQETQPLSISHTLTEWV